LQWQLSLFFTTLATLLISAFAPFRGHRCCRRRLYACLSSPTVSNVILLSSPGVVFAATVSHIQLSIPNGSSPEHENLALYLDLSCTASNCSMASHKQLPAKCESPCVKFQVDVDSSDSWLGSRYMGQLPPRPRPHNTRKSRPHTRPPGEMDFCSWTSARVGRVDDCRLAAGI
jgi:hypothetical protein